MEMMLNKHQFLKSDNIVHSHSDIMRVFANLRRVYRKQYRHSRQSASRSRREYYIRELPWIRLKETHAQACERHGACQLQYVDLYEPRCISLRKEKPGDITHSSLASDDFGHLGSKFEDPTFQACEDR